MYNFVFMLKTYSGDLHFAERLIASFNQHNIDKIPLYIVAPESELNLFSKCQSAYISLLAEEKICSELVDDDRVRGIRPGYINQEIIKLSFGETDIALNYLCLDSDGVFLRDFFLSDFMYDDEIPYTILVEDNELAVEPQYYKEHWASRLELIKHIQEFIGLKDHRILTCHGFAIFNSLVIKSMRIKLLQTKNMTYADLLTESPFEFSWYNMWLQYDKTIPIMFREPLFKYFHHKNQHIEYILRGITSKDMARGYVGVVVNSNYSRDFGLISMDSNRLEVLSKYISLAELKSMFLFKLKNKMKRVLKELTSGAHTGD